MQTTVKVNGPQFDKLNSFLQKGVVEPAEKSVKRIVGFASNRMGLKAKSLVYSYVPKTKNYKRTGRLLGGRDDSTPAINEISKLKTEIKADPRLKGAKTNYAPIVNDGYSGTFEVKSFQRKSKKGKVHTVKAHKRKMEMEARPFFTETVEDTEKEVPKIVEGEIDKFLNKKLFN